MMKVSAALMPFLQPVLVTRKSFSYDDNKRLIPDAPVTFTIKAAVMPATEQDLQIVPEGEYTNENLKLFSQSELFIGNDDNVKNPDIVSYSNWNYKIIARGNWAVYGYYKYIATKIDAAA